MKTLLIALSFLAVNAHAAIPKRVDITSQNWCTKRPSEERMDKIMFKDDGKVTIQTFHSTGDLEKVSTGTWQLKNDKLTVNTEKRPSSLSVAISEDGQSLNFSTGMKATSCN